MDKCTNSIFKSWAAPTVYFAEPLPSHIFDFMLWGVGSFWAVFYAGWECFSYFFFSVFERSKSNCSFSLFCVSAQDSIPYDLNNQCDTFFFLINGDLTSTRWLKICWHIWPIFLVKYAGTLKAILLKCLCAMKYLDLISVVGDSQSCILCKLCSTRLS